MNDTELDALLNAPLPERDAAEFSVVLMERIARHQARPARILSWIMVGVLFVVIAAACIFGATVASHNAFDNPLTVPLALAFLTLVLSYTVLQAARE